MRLCSHLVLFYAWEQVELNEGSLLCRFMRRAAPEYKTEVLQFMGRVLSEEEGLPEPVITRFVAFHKWWQEELSQEFPQGWKSFSQWFTSAYLAPSWKIKKLVLASEHSDFGYRNEKVLTALKLECFGAFPEQTLTIVSNYISHKLAGQERWDLDYKDALPEILKMGHHHENPDISRRADELLGRLVSEGFMKYREIVEENVLL